MTATAHFNEAQRQAVEDCTGSLLVLAGPGTGKTKVIISKIIHLVRSESLDPESILAVTFSRRATLEMQERLSESDAKLSQRVEINTLHGFCFELVRKHGFRMGFQKKIRLISESEAQLLFRDVTSRLPIPPFLKRTNFEAVADDLFALFQEAKDEGLWPEDFIRYANSLKAESEAEKTIQQEWVAIGDIFNAYQSYCFQQGLIDFGDSILCALRILEDYPIVQDEFHQKLKAVLVDEFQDTNYSQVRLLRALVSPNAHVIAVGDDDQSIYRFRGASYSAFRFFEEMFSPLKIVELTTTYRLTPAIASTASQLISANGTRRFRPEKKLFSAKASNKAVEILEFSDAEQEALWVAKKIENQLKEGRSPSEIAVLVRAHSHAAPLLSYAERAGLPLESARDGSTRILETSIAQDALALFRLLVEPQNSIAYLRLLDSPFVGLPGDEIYALLRSARSEVPFLEQMESLGKELPLQESSRQALRAFHRFYFEAFGKAAGESASQILLRCFDQLDVLKFLYEKDQASLHVLSDFHHQLIEWESLQPEKNLRSLLNLLENFSKTTAPLVQAEDGGGVLNAHHSKAVSVLTIHSSKGLEFESVFILSLVGRRFPTPFQTPVWQIPNALRKESPPNKESHIDEERRLLYVGLTRAKSELFLTTFEKKGTRPSLFLRDDLKNAIPSAAAEYKKLGSPATINDAGMPIAEKMLMLKAPFSRVAKPDRPLASPSPAIKGLRLSFSQLEKFERCPLSYHFAYEFRIPTRPSPALLVGSLIHRTLEIFFDRLMISGRSLSIEEFLLIFDREFEESCKNPLNTLSEQDRSIGRKQLSQYYEYFNKHFRTPYAVEKKFELAIGEHWIIGKIDRVDFDESTQTYSIIDFKTGKSHAGETGYAKNSLQLSIYALAAHDVFQWNVSALILHYLETNETLQSSRSAAELELTKAQILNYADRIQRKEFEPRVGRHCQWCEYFRICPAQQKSSDRVALTSEG